MENLRSKHNQILCHGKIWWIQYNTIQYNTISIDGKISQGFKLYQGELKRETNQEDFVSINHQNHQLLESF